MKWEMARKYILIGNVNPESISNSIAIIIIGWIYDLIIFIFVSEFTIRL